MGSGVKNFGYTRFAIGIFMKTLLKSGEINSAQPLQKSSQSDEEMNILRNINQSSFREEKSIAQN